MQANLAYRILQALGGLVLIGMAVNSDWSDAMANYEYGKTINAVAGTVMWSIGLLLVILPATTVLVPKGKGYGIALWAIWAVCIVASYEASTSTYTHGQAAAQGGQIDKHKAHVAAQTKIEDARKRLADNAGPGNAATNGAQVTGAESALAAASKTEDATCKGRRAAASDECAKARGVTLAARQELSGARSILAKAQERDSARVDIAAGEAEAKANPDSIVEQPKIEATNALAVVQLLLTLLSKIGMVILAAAASGPTVKPQKAKRRETADGPTLGGTPIEALGSNVVTLHARKRQVSGWLASSTIAEDGAQIQGGALLKEYRRATRRAIEAAELRTILERLLPAGSVIGRNSGYVVTGCRLKTAVERRAAI